jgi:hypothetical protein
MRLFEFLWTKKRFINITCHLKLTLTCKLYIVHQIWWCQGWVCEGILSSLITILPSSEQLCHVEGNSVYFGRNCNFRCTDCYNINSFTTILNKVPPFATKLLSVHLFIIIITPHYMFRPTGRPSSGAIWQYYIKVKLLNIYSVDPLSHNIHGSNAVENTINKVYNTLKWVKVHSKIPIKLRKLKS